MMPENGEKDALRLDRPSGFLEEVTRLTGTPVGSCYACLSCSGGCPVYEYMDMGPHGVMHRIRLGLREEVLSSRTIWLCVGCHTCSAHCPMLIDISAVMDCLRRQSMEAGLAAEEDVLNFHREVLGSILRYGRTHKLEIMLRFKVRSGRWFEDVDLGLKMLSRRKLDLRPSRIKDPGRLARLFPSAGGEKK